MHVHASKIRSRERTRTCNRPVNSRVLCQLSYAGLMVTFSRASARVTVRCSRRHPPGSQDGQVS